MLALESEQTSSSLGRLLVSTRKRANLTQETLAERAGVSVNTISNLEAGGGHVPRWATIELLAAALSASCGLAPPDEVKLQQALKAAAASDRARRQPVRGGGWLAGEATSGSVVYLACASVNDSSNRLDRTQFASDVFPRISGALRKVAARKGGRLIDLPEQSDVALAAFRSAHDAVTCASAVVQELDSAIVFRT